MKSPFEGWKSSLVKVIEVLYLLWIKKVPWININNLKLVPQSYFDFLYPFILIFPFHPQIPKPLHLGAGVCLVSLQLAWSHLKTLSGNNKNIVQWKYVELKASTTCSSLVSAESSSSRTLDVLAIRFPPDPAARARASYAVLPWPSMTGGSIPTVYCSVFHQFLEGTLHMQWESIIEITVKTSWPYFRVKLQCVGCYNLAASITTITNHQVTWSDPFDPKQRLPSENL